VSRPVRLRVDWAACDGHGLCAEWAPEVITRDEWGFPVVAAGAVPAGALQHARDAVRACPVLALKLLAADPS
jgi:ferredoxin